MEEANELENELENEFFGVAGDRFYGRLSACGTPPLGSTPLRQWSKRANPIIGYYT